MKNECVCVCESQRANRSLTSVASQSGNHTALKAWGCTAVLRTLRSVFSFHTVDAVVALSGGEGGRTPSLPLARAPALLRAVGAPRLPPAQALGLGAAGSSIAARCPQEGVPRTAELLHSCCLPLGAVAHGFALQRQQTVPRCTKEVVI